MFSESDSTCKCGYTEPAGSAHFITFITEVITEYVKSEGIVALEVGNGKISNISSALSSNFLLPAVLINSIQKAGILSVALADLPLTTVDDEKGYYKKRVVTTSSRIANPASILISLGETVSSALNTSMKNKDYSSEKTLCFDYLTPIGGDDNQAISDYVNDNQVYMADRVSLSPVNINKSEVI